MLRQFNLHSDTGLEGDQRCYLVNQLLLLPEYAVYLCHQSAYTPWQGKRPSQHKNLMEYALRKKREPNGSPRRAIWLSVTQLS